MTDDNPTTPPADPTPPPANPSPTPPPATPAPSPASEPPRDNDGPVLAAIGELKDMLTGAVQVITTNAQPDAIPVKKPWFARGGKS